jgi:tRNA dimethylallyltransferase
VVSSAGRSLPILLVVGPTAVGKSEFALRLACRVDGEIVSADSMQVYRGFDAATAKPDPEARARVPHHLLDLVEPGSDFSMGDFVRHGEEAIRGIAGRGRAPIVVGGTGLYVRALLRGMAEAPRRLPRLRARLHALAGRRGLAFAHRMLRRVDPETAARLPERDRQRILRALEVRFASGRPLSAMLRQQPFGEERYDAIKIGLTMERERLEARIEARVDAFFARGLVDEVRGLLSSGCPLEANAWKALGYREARAFVEGALTLAEARRLTAQETRRYAKRQRTWFRKEPGIDWFSVDPDGPDPWAAPLAHAVAAWNARKDAPWA